MAEEEPSKAPYFALILCALGVLPLVVVAAKAFTTSPTILIILISAVFLALGWFAFGPLAAMLSRQTISRKLMGWAFVVALSAAAAVAGVSLFVADQSQDQLVWHHKKDFGVKHNCFTCYAMAAYCDREDIGNVYNPKTLSGLKTGPLAKSLNDRFRVDAYPYPPPFLLLHRGLLGLSEDFFVLRRLWYLIVVTGFVGALLAAAHWCGANRSNPWLLFSPILLVAPSALTALQIQNVHPLVLATAVLGMMAITRNRNLVGPLLLGFAILCKIWPAVLFAPLLMAGRWRNVLSTLLAMLSLSLLSFFVFGREIFVDFYSYQLPRLASGEAFGFMTKHAGAMTANLSVFGFWHKLHAVGNLSGAAPELLNRPLAWGYLLGAAALILLCARATRSLYGSAFKDNDSGQASRLKLLVQWLAVLTLAQLRSPFLPWPYGVISTLWLMVALFALMRGKARVVPALGFLYFAQYVPFSFASKNFNFAYGMVGTLLALGFASFALIYLMRLTVLAAKDSD